jgi:methylase of polypeptide subunit release factors
MDKIIKDLENCSSLTREVDDFVMLCNLYDSWKTNDRVWVRKSLQLIEDTLRDIEKKLKTRNTHEPIRNINRNKWHHNAAKVTLDVESTG